MEYPPLDLSTRFLGLKRGIVLECAHASIRDWLHLWRYCTSSGSQPNLGSVQKESTGTSKAEVAKDGLDDLRSDALVQFQVIAFR